MRNLLLTICYDGSAYHGWQVQENALAVQQVFQEALLRVLGERPELKGCSRTDTGVHARRFCLSLHTGRALSCERLVCALNHFLPPDVAVLACREVPECFHARYDCTGKEYEYRIWNAATRDPFLRGRVLHNYHPLALGLLNEAAASFLGAHDFTSCCTTDARERGDMVRTVTKSEWRKEGDLYTYTVAADGFLYNMVRIMVGTQLFVAQGRLAPGDIAGILAAKNRALAGPTAPPQGLFLNRVFYELGPAPQGAYGPESTGVGA